MENHHALRYTLDFLSIGGVVATLAGWLPPVAALLSIVWLSMQIYDRIKYGPKKK